MKYKELSIHEMNGYDLFYQRDALLRELKEYIRQEEEYGIKLAESESGYKVELAKTALKLKSDGMAVTLINTVILGTGEIPSLRLKRDVNETMRNAAHERVNATKLELRLVEAQIEREWSQANRSV